MLQWLVNYWKGRVTVRVESAFPERVLNLCAARRIAFWNLRWETPLVFTFSMTGRDYVRMRRCIQRLQCEIYVTEREGMPFFLGQFRRRYVLLIGLSLCLLLGSLGSFFIWDFRIEGNVQVREEEILRALEECGVSLGTFGYGIQSEQLRNDMLLKIDKLSYIALNVKGCRAHVQVRERIEPPELVDKRKPGNTVAAKDALVTDIRPYDGKKLVLPGTTVREGQLLIAGVTDDAQAGTRFLRGMGKVYGRTWYALRCHVGGEKRVKEYTGKDRVHLALCWGRQRLELPGGRSVGERCDKLVERRSLTLPGGLALPVGIVKETYRLYEERTQPRSREEAETLAAAVLGSFLRSGMEEGEVLSEGYATVSWEGGWLTELKAECREEIGEFRYLPMAEEESPS